MAVSHYEVKGYPIEYADSNGWRGERLLRCAWASRYDLVDELLASSGWRWPYSQTVGTTPYSWPAYVVSTKIMPDKSQQGQDGSDASQATYQNALILVEYTTATVTGNSNLVSETLETDCEMMDVRHPSAYWDVGSNVPETVALQVPVEHLTYVRTLYHQPTVPAASLTMLGTCNSDSYVSASLGLTFGAGSLRFVGTKANHAHTLRGVIYWTCHHIFRARYYQGAAVSWNKFFNPETALFDDFYLPGGGIATPYTATAYANQFG